MCDVLRRARYTGVRHRQVRNNVRYRRVLGLRARWNVKRLAESEIERHEIRGICCSLLPL